MVKEKPGFLTAKAISNRIKSKGLQKLRWFCQMCQKQCRDENGFKCHITSESHHRQMLLFDENSNHFLGNYTRIFMKGYLDVLRRQFGGKRTQANVIYQEYIKDKEHVHMNSTKFTTLTGFINCLHKMGICRVDQTDKGWFIEYIAKDPEQEHLERKKRKLNKTLAEDDEQFFEMIEKHLGSSSKKPRLADEDAPTDLIKSDPDEKITFQFMRSEPKVEPVAPKPEPEPVEKLGLILTTTESTKFAVPVAKSETRPVKEPTKMPSASKKPSTLEQLKLEQEREKERRSRTRHWLHEGIAVRLVESREVPRELQQREAVVRRVEDRFWAVVKTIEPAVSKDGASGSSASATVVPPPPPSTKLRVHQDHVITVVPRPGALVLLVNGAYRGCRARLVSVDRKRFTAELDLVSGIHAPMQLHAVSYDDFSKLHDDQHR